MKFVGAHVSIAGGVSKAPLNAHEIGARSFALFTGSSSRWVSKPITDEDAEEFRNNCKEYGYQPEHILPHDNFLINLGSPDPKKLALSRKSFLDEMKRCEKLGLTMLNFHPGSHVNEISEEDCLKLIAESLNQILAKTSGVKAVIETTAGQGSNLGHRFEEIAKIMEHVDDKSRLGVCLDTCHSYSAGYDLASAPGYDRTWKEFDDIIGRDYLCGIHLNDDKRELGSRIDRHASLRQGTLGEEFFERFMNDPRFNDIPIILETPEPELWPEEIEWLYSLVRRE